MTDAGVLLRAYYEMLYERLTAREPVLRERIARHLHEALAAAGWTDFDSERYVAYLDAALAFLHERLEMYNPIGFQYTLEPIHSPLAARIELELDWYNATAEFERLRQAARSLAEPDMDASRLQVLAAELIDRCGAFPDRSIIDAYHEAPAVHKTPDYALALAIEETL